MVRLPALLDLFASFGGPERNTWEVFSRRLRDAGRLSPSKRGWGAAPVSMEDASTLLMAALLTPLPTYAPRVIEDVIKWKPSNIVTEAPEDLKQTGLEGEDDPILALAKAISFVGPRPDWQLIVTSYREDKSIELVLKFTPPRDDAGVQRFHVPVYRRRWEDSQWNIESYWFEEVSLHWKVFHEVFAAVSGENSQQTQP